MAQNPNNPKHKRNATEVEADRALVAKLYLQGKTQAEIAEELSSIRTYTLTQQTISDDLKALVKEWRKQRFDDIDELKGEEISRLNRVEAEAWSAWFRSCKKRVEVSASLEDAQDPRAAFAALVGFEEDESDTDDLEIGADGIIDASESRKIYKETKKVLHRDGNPAFLELVKSCIVARCKIIGIEAPKNITFKTEYIVGIEE